MNARKELDDHTCTLHVGSKIRLYGLLNQTLNGKKGSVLGTARTTGSASNYRRNSDKLASASPISDTGTTWNRVAKYFMKEW